MIEAVNEKLETDVKIVRQLKAIGFKEYVGQPWAYRYWKRKKQDLNGRKAYLQGWRSFLGHHNLTGQEAIEKVERLVKKRDLDGVVEMFVSWFEDKSGTLAFSTMKAWAPGVKTILFTNGVDIEDAWRRISKNRRNIWEDERRERKKDFANGRKLRLKTKHVQTIMANTPGTKTRAIIMVLATSGMRVSDALKLKFKDIKDPLEEERDSYRIEVMDPKTDEPYITFITREARDFLQTWLNERRRKNEKAPPDKREAIGPESYVFTARRGVWNPKEGGPLDYDAFRNMLVRALDRCDFVRTFKTKGGMANGRKGKPFKRGHRRNLGAHDFRRFFSTQLDNAGVKNKARSALGGWMTKELKASLGLGGSLYSYAEKNVDWLRSEYEKAVSFLTITRPPVTVKEVEEQHLKRIGELEKEVGDLQKTMKKFVEGIELGEKTFYLGPSTAGTDFVQVDADDKVARFVLKNLGFKEREIPGVPDKVGFIRKMEGAPTPPPRTIDEIDLSKHPAGRAYLKDREKKPGK